MTGPERITVPYLRSVKGKSRIAMLTAYDYPTARILDRAGVDAILVGDSLAMVVQGHETTLPVTLDQMIYHAQAVGRAVERALVIVDLPFPTFFPDPAAAIDAAARILKESHCQAVKLEGGLEQVDTIKALVTAGIPVMGHVGLRPQSVHQSGYRVERDAEKLRADAHAAEQAGAFAIVLECVPASLAGELTRALNIPTIGIGAGPECDGQVLVLHDALGFASNYVPRFVKAFANVPAVIEQAVQEYCQEVRQGEFPTSDHSYK